MREKISNLQLIFLIANFIMSAAVISLPQIIVHTGRQNAWLVPIVSFPFFLLIIYLIFGKKGKAERFEHLFAIGKKGSLLEKGIIILFFFLALLVFVRDLRALVDFVASVLLPNTPINMLMVLSTLVIIYISMAGIEVIARINAIHFFIFIIVSLFLPFLLLNELDAGNLQPLPGLHSFKALTKSVFISFSWIGELFFFILIIANVNPLKAARKAVITGTALGVFLFLILLILNISVLGTKIVREAAYPTYILVQQINLTDFLDRLDLVIVSVWIPVFFCKVAFLMYVINFCFSYFYKSNTNKFLVPIAFTLGYLSILLFKNSMEHIHFSFYAWNSLGIFLEGSIVILFLFLKRTVLKRKETKPANTS